jgi:hypothetical protein
MVVAAAATFVSCGVCSAFLQPKANRTAHIKMVRDFIGLFCTNVNKEKDSCNPGRTVKNQLMAEFGSIWHNLFLL